MDTIIQSSVRSPNRSGYRRHTIDFKRAVVEQSLTTGASVSLIAREHDINANQVFAWRKAFQEGRLEHPTSSDCKLLPVMLAELPDVSKPMRTPAMAAVPVVGAILLEVDKARLRIEGSVDGATLALVLERFLR
jgi:transposase